MMKNWGLKHAADFSISSTLLVPPARYAQAAFVDLAEEYGLELVEWRNFHDYVHNKLSGGGGGGATGKPGEMSKEAAHALWRMSMGGKSVEEATLTEDEWQGLLFTQHVFALST